MSEREIGAGIVNAKREMDLLKAAGQECIEALEPGQVAKLKKIVALAKGLGAV